MGGGPEMHQHVDAVLQTGRRPMNPFGAITFGAVLALAGPLDPARAEGPLNDRGELDYLREGWTTADAGNNPLSAREAAAALALIGVCIRAGELDRGKLDHGALVRDVMAGGTTPEDYQQGGTHRALYTGYQEEVTAYLENAPDSLMKLLICDNPYTRPS